MTARARPDTAAVRPVVRAGSCACEASAAPRAESQAGHRCAALETVCVGCVCTVRQIPQVERFGDGARHVYAGDMAEVHDQTIELVLASIHNQVGDDGMMHAFMFHKPGRPKWGLGDAGTEIFFSLKGITLAALYVRRHGPNYLRALSISDIRRLLTDFIHDHFWWIAEETFGHFFTECYAAKVSVGTKAKLAQALATSPIFVPANELSLFPLVPVQVDACFSSPQFFFRAPATLLADLAPDIHAEIDASVYPPVKDTMAKKEIPGSWLGIRSPNEKAALKTKAAILGAAALTATHGYRYMFSGRHMFGGVSTIKGGVSFNFGRAHTPPLMEDIHIRPCDHAWLSKLAAMTASDDPVDQRQLRALEYFYRAWGQPEHERYPLHCMALEAMFGKKNNNTQAVKDGVQATLGAHIAADRIGALLKVRGDVIHGQAPDVYDSEEYDIYYRTYSEDPVHDLAVLTAAALRQRLFGADMVDQEEPHQEIIAQAKAKGRIPENFGSGGHGILTVPSTLPVTP